MEEAVSEMASPRRSKEPEPCMMTEPVEQMSEKIMVEDEKDV